MCKPYYRSRRALGDYLARSDSLKAASQISNFAETIRRFSRALAAIDGILESLRDMRTRRNDSDSEGTTAIVLPILELQEEHFLYRVVEHAADESVQDGEALDLKLSALLAAQAAIAAIFLAKDWPGFAGALVFTVLTVLTIVSLRLKPYRRAPRAARFGADYITNPKAVRDKVILDKIDAIRYNDNLVANKSKGFKWLLWATVVALVVFLGTDAYNGYRNEHSGTTQAAASREQQGFGSAHKQPGRNSLRASRKRRTP